jgi:hypothetical protein
MGAFFVYCQLALHCSVEIKLVVFDKNRYFFYIYYDISDVEFF